MKIKPDARKTPRLPSTGRRLFVAFLTLVLGCVAAAGQRREPRKLFRISGERGGTGFIDRTGRVVIPPTGLDFGEVVRSGVYQLPLERHGRKDELSAHRRRASIADFSDGMARFCIDARPGSRALWLACGFIDETGKVVIPPVYGNIGVTEFREGRAMINVNSKRGYIDRAGKVVIPPTYALTWGFSEGLAPACLKNDIKDNQCGYIDRDGKVVHPFTLYAGMPLSEGLALIGIDGVKMAYIDKSMRVVFKLREGDYGGEFHDGLAWLRVGGYHGKYGFMDRTGKIVIPVEYDEVRDFSEGKALVKRGESWGFIDRAGRVAIPFKYAYGSSFSEGLAAVTVARERMEAGWGYIDHDGKVRIPLELDYGEPFSGGLAAVDRTVDGNPQAGDAYIDTQGRTVWEKPPRVW